MNDIQVWNNAAFDGNNNTQDSFFPMKTSWSSSECTKENLSPPAPNHNSSKKHTTATKKISNKGFGFGLGLGSDEDDKNIDDEIEEIEREIKRLTTRLDALRLEKAKRSRRVVVGRVVAAKFMEPRPNAAVLRKPLETPKTKAKSNNNSVWRRGMSLGPAEIAVATTTPATALQSRRKSCFWKIPEIDEEARAKTTVGRVKKKEENSVVRVQGKKLFEKEKVKSVVCESGKKGGRVVASRYNSNNGGGDLKKRSLPEGGSEIRFKKRWEIPKKEEEEEEVVVLPKIKTLKCLNESPRDSGAAKRVAELVGKRSYFSKDEKDVCQILEFAQEEEEE